MTGARIADALFVCLLGQQKKMADHFSRGRSDIVRDWGPFYGRQMNELTRASKELLLST